MVRSQQRLPGWVDVFIRLQQSESKEERDPTWWRCSACVYQPSAKQLPPPPSPTLSQQQQHTFDMLKLLAGLCHSLPKHPRLSVLLESKGRWTGGRLIKISYSGSFQYLSCWFPGQPNLFIKATGKTTGIRYCFLGILSRLSFGLKEKLCMQCNIHVCIFKHWLYLNIYVHIASISTFSHVPST